MVNTRDNKGRFSTLDENTRDKTAGRKRGPHGKWITKNNTNNRENNTKACRNNTIDLTDTKEDIHCTERSEIYDAETDDEPSTTTRTDISTIEKTVESLPELVEKQGAKIAALENALESSRPAMIQTRKIKKQEHLILKTKSRTALDVSVTPR